MQNIGYRIRQFLFSTLSMKDINRIRKIKWFLLGPFVNDKKLIRRFYHKEVEIKVLEQLFCTVLTTPFQKVLDIGANIGEYSSYLSKFIRPYEGICIGFEPRNDIIKRLKRNVTEDNFLAEQVALSNKAGVADLFLPANHGRSSLVPQKEFTGFKTEKVTLISLDSYVRGNNLSPIVFIKIDVEGHELEVLEGACVVIRQHKPLILCESENSFLISQGRSVTTVINYIKTFGYNAFVISRKRSQLISAERVMTQHEPPSGKEDFCNYWFIHESQAHVVESLRNIVQQSLFVYSD